MGVAPTVKLTIKTVDDCSLEVPQGMSVPPCTTKPFAVGEQAGFGVTLALQRRGDAAGATRSDCEKHH